MIYQKVIEISLWLIPLVSGIVSVVYSYDITCRTREKWLKDDSTPTKSNIQTTKIIGTFFIVISIVMIFKIYFS